MLAAQLQAFGQPLVWGEVAVPTIGATDVLVQVRACGIDGTDLKLMQGFGYEPDLPFIPGHEIAGVVAATGARVAELPPGVCVVVYNFETCGACAMCQAQRAQLCLRMGSVMGVKGAHGGYAEYVRVPARQIVPMPLGLPFPDGATCCDAGLTAFHAVERAAVQAGERVLVIGVGGVGSFAVQLIRQRDATPVAVERGPEKVAWARAMGAQETIDGARPEGRAAYRASQADAGFDCVLDIVGTQATMQAGIQALRPGGRIVLVGYTPDDLRVPGKELAQREIQVLGTRAGARQDLQAVAQLLADGALRSIVSETHPMAAANEALARLQSGRVQGRIVLLAPGAHAS